MADTLQEQLTKHLTDVHSIEEQALRLVRAKQISGEDALLLVVCPSQRVRRTLRTATE